MSKRRAHLSHEEERVLGRRMKAGDVHARHALVEAHYGFVLWIVARYTGAGVDADELKQAGSLGLMEALERYDPERPTRLLTMAFYSIRRHIVDVIREEHGYNNVYGRPARIKPKHSIEGNIPEELRQRPISMSTPYSDADTQEPQVLSDIIADPKAIDPADAVEDNEGATIAKAALRRMKTRTRQIVQMRLGIARDKRPGLSFVEIGRHFGISAERVRRIFIHAIKKLRRKLDDE